MGIPKGPTEGGSGGRRGHSGMEHWGYTDEVISAARRRRRLIDKKVVNEQAAEQPPRRIVRNTLARQYQELGPARRRVHSCNPRARRP